MTEPFLLAQLSDLHIGGTWGGDDSEGRLAAAVQAVLELRPAPRAVLVSGDLTDHALDAEYERVRELLSPLALPLYVLPGNHDDRAQLRRYFGVPGSGDEPVQYSADLGSLRLVVLDTTRPGEDPGALDGERLGWLDAELAAAPDAPTLIAMHHPPLATGVAAIDAVGLPGADTVALERVLEGQPQVRRLVCGHLHLTTTAELAGRPVLVVPSTYVQARLDFEAAEVPLSDDPPGFALHTVLDGQLLSHMQFVA